MSMIESQIKNLKRARGRKLDESETDKLINDAIRTIEELSAKLAAANMERSSAFYNDGWILVKWRETMPEDGIDMAAYPIFMDCHMPDDGEEILVSLKSGYVEKDVCYFDDGFYLDSGHDWIEDIEAWMPLPEPYRPEEEE